MVVCRVVQLMKALQLLPPVPVTTTLQEQWAQGGAPRVGCALSR